MVYWGKLRVDNRGNILTLPNFIVPLGTCTIKLISSDILDWDTLSEGIL